MASYLLPMFPGAASRPQADPNAATIPGKGTEMLAGGIERGTAIFTSVLEKKKESLDRERFQLLASSNKQDFINKRSELRREFNNEFAQYPLDFEKQRELRSKFDQDIRSLNYNWMGNAQAEADFNLEKERYLETFNINLDADILRDERKNARTAFEKGLELAIQDNRWDDAGELLGMGEGLYYNHEEADLMQREFAKQRLLSESPLEAWAAYLRGDLNLTNQEQKGIRDVIGAENAGITEAALSGSGKYTKADIHRFYEEGKITNELELKVAMANAADAEFDEFVRLKPQLLNEAITDALSQKIVDPDSAEGVQIALNFKNYWGDRIGLSDSEVNSVLGLWKDNTKAHNISFNPSDFKEYLLNNNALNGLEYAYNLNAHEFADEQGTTLRLDGEPYSYAQTHNGRVLLDANGKFKSKKTLEEHGQLKESERVQNAALGDAMQNWYSVMLKFSGWRAHEGKNANDIEQANMFKKFLQDVTGKKVHFDTSFLESETTANLNRNAGRETIQAENSNKLTEKDFLPLPQKSPNYSFKLSSIPIDPSVEEDALVVGREALATIPQIAQYLDEAGNFKDIEKAKDILSRMRVTIVSGKGTKAQSLPVPKFVISPQENKNIRLGIGTGVKFGIGRNGFDNAEIRLSFDNEPSKDAYGVLSEVEYIPNETPPLLDEGLLPEDYEVAVPISNLLPSR